jgi:hypothetical protein
MVINFLLYVIFMYLIFLFVWTQWSELTCDANIIVDKYWAYKYCRRAYGVTEIEGVSFFL